MAKRTTKAPAKPDGSIDSIGAGEPLARNPRWTGDRFWYRGKVGEPVHQKLVTHATALRSLYSAAHNRDRVHKRLYEGTEIKRYQGAMQALRQAGFNPARLNVSKSVVNTVVSRLSKSRATPSIMVDDAEWNLKRKAKQYRKFIIGEMMATEFDQRSKEALRDGAVLGQGITRIDDSGDGERVICERMLREELFYDPRECKYGKPPNAIRIWRIARDHLAEIYPDFASQIYTADASAQRGGEEIDEDNKSISLEDYVDVYEGWHLPYCDGDGRHIITTSNATIISELWEEERFPWAMYRYQKPMDGIWAKGLIYELKDIQHRINCIVRDMQMNLQAVGRGHYLMQEGNEVPVEMLTGFAPFTIKYKGSRAPTWNAPAAFNQAQVSALELFINQAYDLPGVSRLTATSKSSLGSGASGVALDTQYDIESDRFAMEEGQYADYRLDSGQLYIDASKRVAKKRKAQEGTKKSSVYYSNWLHGDSIEKLEHDKVSLERDQFRLQLEPINFIPSTRAGKLSAVGQLAQGGIIPQWLAAALFDEPDLARANRITLAAFWNCERKMDLLGNEEVEMPMPAPYNDLELELTMTKAYLNNAENEKAPPMVMDRYLTYLDLVMELIKKKKKGDALQASADMPPPMSTVPPGPEMPGAAPMLPPGAPMPPANLALPGGMPS